MMAAKIRVLYVDDERDLLELGKLYLEQSGDFIITTVQSTSEALRILELKKFDAIISDYQMPEMDGIQFLKIVRARGDKTPFIIFTGKGREDVVIEALNAGADFYLQKGGEPKSQFAELAHKVRQSVGKYKAEKQIKLSEDKFSAAFAFSPDPVAITESKSGTFISVNPAFSAWSGYSSDELIGKTTKDLNFWFNALDRDEIVASLQAHENVNNKSIKLRIKNGDIRDCQFSAQFISIEGLDCLFTRSHDITDIIRANQALQQSEDRFRAIFAYQQNGILIIDPSEHCIVDANPYFCHLVGLPKDQIVGKVCHTFICPAEKGKCPITDLGQCVDNSERVLIAADGRKIPIIKTVVNAKFLDNECLIENIQDITERKRVEEALRESEEWYRTILQTTNDGFWIIDLSEGHLTDVNETYCRMSGYTRAELLKMHIPDLDAQKTPDEQAATLKKIITNGSGIFETRHHRKDGSVFDVELSVTYQNTNGGRLICFCRDITERKLAEEDLKEHDEKIRILLDSTAEAIYGLDMNGNCTFCNNSCLRLLGYKHPRELLGKNMHWQIHHKHPNGTHFPVEDCRIFRAFKKGEGTHVDDEVLWRSDGTSFPAEYWSYPQHHEGKVVGAVVTFLDISERKELENEMDYHEQELQKFSTSLATANRKLTLLSSITRHDINNQLTVQMGYIALLEQKQLDPTTFNNYFGKISAAAQRISAMIQFTKEYENIGVTAPTWQDCRTLLATATKEAPLGKVMVKNDLPPGTEVFADSLIVKVFYNLMDNAVRYGGKITTIRFSVEEREGDHLIVCEDDGDGIVAEEKEKIFERGFGKNTGLGLALSCEILAITGITIRETGKPGNGARFEITVPKGAWRMTGKSA